MSPPESITLQTHLDVDDMVAFNLHWHHLHSQADESSKAGRWFSILALCVTCLVLLIVCWIAAGSLPNPGLALLGAIAILVSLSLLGRMFEPSQSNLEAWIRRTLKSRAQTAVVGPHTIAITAGEITEEGPYRRSATRWEAVERIAISPTHAFIYTAGSGAYIIPKRCDEGEEQFREFVRSARAFWRAVHPTAPDDGSTAGAYEQPER